MESKTRSHLRGLYAISDGPRADLIDVCTAALGGGARMLQYRDKTLDHARRLHEARALQEACAQHEIPLLINDDIELAAVVGAAGVHLGAGDAAIRIARDRLGPSAIIGASCYESLDRARAMAAAGADYLAFGAFFRSPTKPQAVVAPLQLLRAGRAVCLPVVAIGGITLDNARTLVDSGADAIAVISALFGASDVRATAARFAALFENANT